MTGTIPTQDNTTELAAPHPRTIGWLGTTALAMGGANQSLFLIGALIVGQGSAAVPLLILGLLLSWAAAPGWTELILMWPNRVGGIAATCAEAFRPYSPVLANLTGVCYWWGWVPTCGLTAIFSATALHEWFLPMVPIPLLACLLVACFTAVNLCGVRWVTRLAIPLATISASLAFLSGIIPVLTGHVDWRQATSFHLVIPFGGFFGGLTGAMAGLYLVGFAAPAFEAAACHVGETVDPARQVPRAMFASAAMATVYFVLLPVIWLGVLGPDPLTGDLAQTLGPTFAPLLGQGARAAAIWFMMFNMFHGTLQPLAGASRTLAQLAEDGLLPRTLARRSSTDTPWVATLLTAGMAIAFLLIGDPTWLIAAANLTYLIGIGLPSAAVWLLRRDAPAMPRPYRAPRGAIGLGLCAAAVWGIATVFGFEQFGLPTVLAGLALAYSGSALYVLRVWSDRRRTGKRGLTYSLHLTLTGAMLLVLTLDGIGYLLAVKSVHGQTAFVALLEDIFVVVALLTISVGLVLPGIIAHAAGEVAHAADRLATGTIADFLRAMQALGAGDLDAAHARVESTPLPVRSRNELGAMAASFNALQEGIAGAALALHEARDGLRQARDELQHQARHDALTGLPNRTLLTARLEEALQCRHTPVALLLMDLDRFKEVNDTLGHQYGDLLLQEVSSRVQRALRTADTAARLGGDEFALLLPATDEAGASTVARKILAQCAMPYQVQDRSIDLGASIGIALSPTHAMDVATLLRQADVAMYVAKATGGGYALYTAEQDHHSPDRLTLASDLRQAIDQDQLVLYYQPLVDLASGHVQAVEALARWQHPQRGLIAPGEFIPLAEQTGLIGALTLWVLEEALRQCQTWQHQAIPLDVMVNLSMRTLHDPQLPQTVAWLLRRYQIPAGRLTLEITESSLMADPQRAAAVLAQLVAIGVRMAIDDFGTGYSSLAYLKGLPVHEIKIDRSFVQGMETDGKNAAIVRSVIELGHNLNLAVVAEGVEQQAAWDMLADLHCDVVQGFYLSRPLPAPAFERWLAGWTGTADATVGGA